jgi:sulfate adenylyltransferase subunit 2
LTHRDAGRPSHLRELEAQSIYILREVVAEFENPVLLFSGGKDSMCLVHLARKAFFPGSVPFPLLHIATTWDFRELLEFRDRYCRDNRLDLRIHTNVEALAAGANPFDYPTPVYSNLMQTQALVQALKAGQHDAAFGGARRDEERSRAKERVYSVRDRNSRWEPRHQRPELWNLYNGRLGVGESIRVFPLSDWTELDVWLYIQREGIPLPDLYFAKARPVVEREGGWVVVDDERLRLREGERATLKRVRFRTLGDYPLTACVESAADTIAAVIAETFSARSSERQGRLIDRDEAASMEKKKREGYF